MSGKQGKVPALVLDLGGAPYGWHTVPGVGLVHPDIPVPHPNAEQFVEQHDAAVAEAKKAWDKFEKQQETAHLQEGVTHGPLRQHGRLPFPAPPCPVRLVHVSQAQADKGAEAHAEARAAVTAGLRQAVRSTDDTEKALALSERAALADEKE
jgi:hypothetical protein